MPTLPLAALDLASDLISEVRAGGRASAALSRAISERRLGAVAAAQLSALLYATFRRERRVSATLGDLGAPLEGAMGARLLAIGAALLEGPELLDVEGARRAWSEVAWQRFLTLDRARMDESRGVERVALSGSLPDFLAEALLAQYGEEATSLAASLSEPAPRALRVNSLKADVQQAAERLAREGAVVRRGAYGRRSLRLEGAFNPFITQTFHDGWFELQDEGSQLACELVAPPPRGSVVDACAGAGGKSLALAAALEGRGKVLALDVDEAKLGELRRRAKRAGAANVQARAIGEAGELPSEVGALAGKVDRLLIDAPCSGTGVLRRNPEARLRLDRAAIERLVVTQRAIVERMLPLLAPGGRLVYVTCSLLAAEGEDVLTAIEAAHPELEPVNLAELYDRAYIERFVRSAPHRVRLLPHRHGTDGFFIGVLRRKRG